MAYDKNINASNLAPSQLPYQTLDGILKEATKNSVLLERANVIRMAAGTAKQSVLSSLPDAYWVDNSALSTTGGKPGLKETTDVTWQDKTITAEELAVIVPIPDVVQDDANFNITSELVPLVGEAFGRAVDKAFIFDVNRPTSSDDAIVTAATSAGNVVARSATTDLGENVASAGKLLAEQGFSVNGFMSKPGINWELIGLRDSTGQPIYTPLQGAAGSNLYGYPLNEVTNGAWDASVAELIAADWSKFFVGVRQDITYKVFEEGVITDASGNVVYNLMQQDSKAIRFVFRVGFASMVPVSPVASTRYPAAIITPSGSGD